MQYAVVSPLMVVCRCVCLSCFSVCYRSYFSSSPESLLLIRWQKGTLTTLLDSEIKTGTRRAAACAEVIYGCTPAAQSLLRRRRAKLVTYHRHVFRRPNSFSLVTAHLQPGKRGHRTKNSVNLVSHLHRETCTRLTAEDMAEQSDAQISRAIATLRSIVSPKRKRPAKINTGAEEDKFLKDTRSAHKRAGKLMDEDSDESEVEGGDSSIHQYTSGDLFGTRGDYEDSLIYRSRLGSPKINTFVKPLFFD